MESTSRWEPIRQLQMYLIVVSAYCLTVRQRTILTPIAVRKLWDQRPRELHVLRLDGCATTPPSRPQAATVHDTHKMKNCQKRNHAAWQKSWVRLGSISTTAATTYHGSDGASYTRYVWILYLSKHNSWVTVAEALLVKTLGLEIRCTFWDEYLLSKSLIAFWRASTSFCSYCYQAVALHVYPIFNQFSSRLQLLLFIVIYLPPFAAGRPCTRMIGTFATHDCIRTITCSLVLLYFSTYITVILTDTVVVEGGSWNCSSSHWTRTERTFLVNLSESTHAVDMNWFQKGLVYVFHIWDSDSKILAHFIVEHYSLSNVVCLWTMHRHGRQWRFFRNKLLLFLDTLLQTIYCDIDQ